MLRVTLRFCSVCLSLLPRGNESAFAVKRKSSWLSTGPEGASCSTGVFSQLQLEHGSLLLPADPSFCGVFSGICSWRGGLCFSSEVEMGF